MRRIPSRRRTMAGVVVAGATVASLAFAPSAWAATLEKDKAAPVVDESITFTLVGPNECTPIYTFTVDDGPSEPPQSSPDFTTSFATSGSHTVTVDVTYSDGGCGPESDSLTFDVRAALAGSIAVSPDPPAPNQTATLSATQTGGYAPFTYAWDIDNDGAFDDETTRIVDDRFTTTGPHVVRVRIRDSAPEVHEESSRARSTSTSPPPDDPPPPPPPPCVQRLAFALSEFTTDGCFGDRRKPLRHAGRRPSAVKLNGISFPDFGQTVRDHVPSASEPGGHFSAPDSAIRLGSLTVFSGDIDWTLPDGEQGDEETVDFVGGSAVRAALRACGAAGSTEVRLGWGDDGEHYAVFPLNIELPAVFTPGPYTGSEAVTGSASLRVDDEGPHFDGLKLISDGRVDRPDQGPRGVLLLRARGRADGRARATPRRLTASRTSRARPTWTPIAGTATPSSNCPSRASPQFAAFGGLADGRVSKLGGFADNLGVVGADRPRRVPQADRAGLCLSPPPFKVRGDVGVELLGGKLRVNGRVLYTDAFEGKPWSLEVGGNATDRRAPRSAEGSMTFNAWGDIDFGLSAEMDLFDVATISGADRPGGSSRGTTCSTWRAP